MSHTRLIGRIALAFLLGLLFIAGPAAPANAQGVTQVSGVFVNAPDGACTELPSVEPPGLISGSLTGCWYLTTVERTMSGPSGFFYATGTETFVGCLGETCGRFFTTFTFTAQYAADGSEIHGRCHHPITGGEGGFAGASGVINMHDDPVNGCAYYKGHITL